jgi:hypothetical protein
MEPLSLLGGSPPKARLAGFDVQVRTGDLEPSNDLCRKVHGHDRSGELADGIRRL